MKRFFTILMSFIIWIFASSCANQPESLPTDSNEKISLSVNSANSTPSVSGKLNQTADWPTKEWSICSPDEQGMNSSKLLESDKRIKENYPNIYSLLVVRHGYLVYEKYYNGMDKKSANPVYSVTKSVTSALTGIALREKLIKSVDQSIGELLPEYFTNIDDVGKKSITVKNVLTMTGGLDSIDNNFPSYYLSDDWIKYTVNMPLIDKPGQKFVYNTGLAQCLSGIITKESGISTKEFADKYLFSKIGITVTNWERDSKGCYGGGVGLSMTPRDMAKFGYLYLNGGKWDGKQIIPEEWVAESSKEQITANEDEDYGYLFWVQTMREPVSGKSYSTYRADGAGGQKIIMIPELDMVAVVTADERSCSKDGADTQKIISDYVFPAVNNT